MKHTNLIEVAAIPYEGKVSAKGKMVSEMNKHNRSLTQVVGTFYLLEEMLLETPHIVDSARHVLYIDDVSQAMFDYLLYACWGEAQYAHKSGIYFGEKNLLANGGKHYHALSIYSPLELIPILEQHFLVKGGWSGGFGGKKWAAIAKALGQFYKFPRKVWFDHVVNLSHNGGLAFDKGLIWQEPGKAEYIGFLDLRREGSILEKLDKTKAELAWLFFVMGLSNICPPRHERMALGDKIGVVLRESDEYVDPENDDDEDNEPPKPAPGGMTFTLLSKV